jgi:hypothetical protein
MDEFGVHLFGEITAETFTEIPFSTLIPLPFFEYQLEDPSLGVINIDEVNDVIRNHLQSTMKKSEVVYQLNLGKKEKMLGSGGRWNHFDHFVGIDAERQTIKLITFGSD